MLTCKTDLHIFLVGKWLHINKILLESECFNSLFLDAFHCCWLFFFGVCVEFCVLEGRERTHYLKM